MTTEKTTAEKQLKGLLECPLRKGFIEFEFSKGDRVSDLKSRIQEVWGPPRSGIEPELRTSGRFWDADAWIVCCEADDGTFVSLRDSDQVPVSPPAAEGDVADTIMDRAARRFKRNWQGLIHEHDLFPRRLNLVFTRDWDVETTHDHDVRLVALVAITGG